MSVAINDGGRDPKPGAERLLADAARAAQAVHDRLAGVLVDFFLPEAHRTTDRTRASMARMLDQLIAALETDLRTAIAPHFAGGSPEVAAALTSPRIAIAVPILERSRVLHDGDLIGLLLARAEEQRIVAGLRRIAEADSDIEPIATPAAIDDIEAADADQALREAENRATGGGALDPRDLPADLFHRLLWWIAAALRDYVVRVHRGDSAQADQAIAAAAADRLAAHDEGATMDALAMRLARHRQTLGRANDADIRDALRRGRFSVFVALLAVRAGIGHDVARAMASDPGIVRLAVLLKAVEIDREVATGILFELAAINGLSETALIACIDDLRDLDVGAARAAIEPWRLDRGYRSAVADLAAGLATAR